MSEPVEQIRLTTHETPLGSWVVKVWSEDHLMAESLPTDHAGADDIVADLTRQLAETPCDHCHYFVRYVNEVAYDDGRLTVFGTCGNER